MKVSMPEDGASRCLKLSEHNSSERRNNLQSLSCDYKTFVISDHIDTMQARREAPNFNGARLSFVYAAVPNALGF